MATNNRNSSSSSFTSYSSGIGNAANSNNAFKSNSTSTFDIFNINVKDAQKKVNSVFEFTKGKAKENEKLTLKSIKRIFSTINSGIIDSADKFDASVKKSFDILDSRIDSLATRYRDKMKSSMDEVLSHSHNGYDEFYDNLSRQHDKYIQDARDKEKSMIDDFKDMAGDVELNIDTTSIANDIADKLSTMEIQCKCICECSGKDNKSGRSGGTTGLLAAALVNKSGGPSPEGDNGDALNQISKSSQQTSQNTGNSGSVKILEIILNSIQQILKMFWDEFIGGARKWYDQYESSYNQLSTAFATDRKQTHELAIRGTKELENVNKGMIKAVNFAGEYLPMLEEVSKQGLMGDNAVAKAVTDSIDKKIMPWLETSSEQWVNMNTYLSEDNLNTLKGQQLMLQKMESGNRLLQSGVINSMTGDMEPLLRNIDFNTGGAQHMTEDAQKMMASLVENAGMTPQEAYEQVKAAIDVQKDQYGALTGGDTSKILMGIEAVQGGDLVDMMQNSTKRIADIAASTGSDLGTSAVYHALGGNLSAFTVENAKAVRDALDDSALNNIDKTLEFNEKKPTEVYSEAVDNILDKVTINQSTTNLIENWGSKIFGFISTEVPKFWPLFDIITGAITAIVGTVVSGQLTNIISGAGGTGGGTSAGFLGGAGSAASIGAGLVATALGATMAGVDSWHGADMSNEWLGKDDFLATMAAGIGSGIGGTGPGLGQGTAEEVAGNVGKNAGKWGLIGAGIGTIIAPGAGTAIGGAIGAGAGALTGLIGGERLAKFGDGWNNLFENFGESVFDFVDLTKNNISNVVSDMKNIWTDENMEFGDKLSQSIESVFKNNKITQTFEFIDKEYGDKIDEMTGGMFSKVKNWGADAKNTFLTLTSAVGNYIENSKLGKTVSGIIEAWKDDSLSIGDKIKETALSIISLDPIGNFINNIINGIKDKAIEAFDNIKNNEFITTMSTAIKATGWFASGSDEIPYDGFVAKLHKGETVFNAKATKAIKDILGIDGKSVGESPLIRKLETIKDKLSQFEMFNKLSKKPITELLQGSFASGKDRTIDGLAKLHKGEMIVSESISKAIKETTGITATSTSLSSGDSSSILDRMKSNNSELIDRIRDEKFDDTRVVKAIADAAVKIVAAVSEDHKENSNSISKIKGLIGKVKVAYDDAIVNMKPIDES